MVHLYAGDGKGKSTAAAGLAMRMLGHEKKVLFCRFLKSGESGETALLTGLGARVLNATPNAKFTFLMSPEELREAREATTACFSEVVRLAAAGEYDLIVLDEVLHAVNAGLLDIQSVMRFAKSCPAELVLTGRDPAPELAELCDYYTEFVCRAHPFEKGEAAREGIEY